MKSASKTVLMFYCAFMRETSVRSRVLVGPSLFCEELKDKRDRINFESVSKGENFLKKKKRKRATTKAKLSSPPEVRFSLFLRRRSLSVSFFA